MGGEKTSNLNLIPLTERHGQRPQQGRCSTREECLTVHDLGVRPSQDKVLLSPVLLTRPSPLTTGLETLMLTVRHEPVHTLKHPLDVSSP